MKKKVLLIGIGFYDYEKAIKQEFENLNYEVDYFSEIPPNNFKYRYYIRTNNKKKLEKIRGDYSQKIADQCGSEYELIFIIKCEYFSVEALQMIKFNNPNAKWILYLWDSMCRFSQIEEKFTFFDKIYSFDRLDCKSFKKLYFNPLFFREEYGKRNTDEIEKYDLYHLGWYHSDRLILTKKIIKYCDEHNFKYKIFLFTGYLGYLFQFFFGGELKGNKKLLIFNPLSAKDNHVNILRSKVTLDITHPSQSGLTMRTIELLGMQKKIITTNADIKNYDFYHKDNIMIIDRENPIIDKSFFQTEFHSISQDIISEYSISNWLKRML